MATDVTQQDVEQAARDSPWPARMGRVGLVTRGVLYGVVGGLALRVAQGDEAQRADRQGALATVVRQPLGRLAALVLAAGFLGYAVWRFAEAILDPEDKGVAKRVGYVARGFVYLGFLWSALAFVTSGAARSDGRGQEDATATVLAWPFGQALVVAIGALVVGVGLWNGWRAVSGSFTKELKSYEMSPATYSWAARLAIVGLVGRMAAYVLCGSFLALAALDLDAADTVGLDASLHRLATHTYGPPMLGLVAVGLMAFGLYQLVLARYRRVMGT